MVTEGRLRDWLITQTSLATLLRDLGSDLKAFVREETALAKSEMKEKVSVYGRNIAILALGGFIAYAGAIALLISFALLLGFAFEQLAIDPVLAVFLGFAVSGLLAATLGGILAFKALKTFSHETPVPEKTVDTLKNIAPGGQRTVSPTPGKPHSESEHLQRKVVATRERIRDEKRELTSRFSLRGLKHQAIAHIKNHPAIWGGTVVAGVGAVAGSVFAIRKLRQSRSGLIRW